jgi:hypothetical protein
MAQCRSQPARHSLGPARGSLANKDSLGDGGFDSGGKIHHSPESWRVRDRAASLGKDWQPDVQL